MAENKQQIDQDSKAYFQKCLKKVAAFALTVCTLVSFSVYYPLQPRPSAAYTGGVLFHPPQTMLQYLHNTSDVMGQNERRDVMAINSSHDVIRITSWNTKLYPRKPWWPEETAFTTCTLPEGMHCEYQHTQNDPLRSDAILFMGLYFNPKQLPNVRRPDQKWLFYDRESMAYIPRDWSKQKDTFNASVTYTRDADVNYNYGFCKQEPTNGYDPSFDNSKGKTKLVSWLVSNCNTKSKRDLYVREMQKYIAVDIFGKCGPLNCGDDGNCETTLVKYKFYLAFENAFCRDYATEKLWRSYRLGVVPVVYGGADYAAILAPGSYIDVRDFKSPQHLAEHLERVGSNATLYNEYFQWQKMHSCQEYRKLNLPCDICVYLHTTRHQQSSLNVYEFWDEDKNCISVATFRKRCKCWPK